jgi:hypothetical protein
MDLEGAKCILGGSWWILSGSCVDLVGSWVSFGWWNYMELKEILKDIVWILLDVGWILSGSWWSRVDLG